MKRNFSGTNLTPEEQQKPELQIARALVEARQKKHVTQQQLAERTGIAQADISRLENGNSNPTLRTLQRLADGLEMVVQVGFSEMSDDDEDEADVYEGGGEEESLEYEDEEDYDDDDDGVNYFPFSGGHLLEDDELYDGADEDEDDDDTF